MRVRVGNRRSIEVSDRCVVMTEERLDALAERYLGVVRPYLPVTFAEYIEDPERCDRFARIVMRGRGLVATDEQLTEIERTFMEEVRPYLPVSLKEYMRDPSRCDRCAWAIRHGQAVQRSDRRPQWAVV